MSLERETLLRLIETLRDYAIFGLDPDGRVGSWNVGAERILGYAEEEIVGEPSECLFTPEDRAEGAPGAELEAAAKHGSSQSEGWRVRKDGSRLWAHVTTAALRDDSGNPSGFLEVISDVTDRDRHEHELARRARQVARLAEERGRLVAQALEAEDRERRRISQALHDDALQTLLSVDQDVADVLKGAEAAAVLPRVREGLARAIRQLRDTALELHPLLLERKGLEMALDTIAQGAAAVGDFRCSVRVEPDAVGVNDQFVLSIARELLMNAAKHAEASRVSVVVERRDERMVIEVADDGAGLPPGRVEAALAEGHIGLAILTERLDAIGGRFEIVTRDGGGTTARAVFPVEAGLELRA